MFFESWSCSTFLFDCIVLQIVLTLFFSVRRRKMKKRRRGQRKVMSCPDFQHWTLHIPLAWVHRQNQRLGNRIAVILCPHAGLYWDIIASCPMSLCRGKWGNVGLGVIPHSTTVAALLLPYPVVKLTWSGKLGMYTTPGLVYLIFNPKIRHC